MENREDYINTLKGSQISAVGFGITGRAVAKCLCRLGIEPVIVDSREGEELGRLLPEVQALGIPFAHGRKGKALLQSADVVIMSPGLSLRDAFLDELKPSTEILSEIELAYRLAPCPIVAVTGTNGKTTTTRLITSILSCAGGEVLTGGNIGEPLIEKALEASAQHLLVAEVSSFQLETCSQFRPYIGVLLNVTRDHLDRHLSFEEYASLKARLFKQQGERDIAIGNLDDPVAREIVAQAPGASHFFSRTEHTLPGTFLKGGDIWYRDSEGSGCICSGADIALRENHNLENLLAAAAVGVVLSISGEALVDGIRHFQAAEHTFERVSVISEVTYINDSNATNPNATVTALQSLKGSVILIAGGSDKRLCFDELREHIRGKVRCLITLGETGDLLQEVGQQAGISVRRKAASLEEAVLMANRLARPGETVLFSPASASFDMFEDYRERGSAFKKAVGELLSEK